MNDDVGLVFCIAYEDLSTVEALIEAGGKTDS